MMKSAENGEVFKGMTFPELMEKIFKNTEDINIKIEEKLEVLSDHPNVLETLEPVKDFLDIKIKNNEQLIKMAGVYQRLVSSTNTSSGGGDGMILTEEEKKRLLESYQESVKSLPKVLELNK